MSKILLIIPAYNEEESLEKTIHSLELLRQENKSDFQYDFLLVNDGSTDQTLKIARKLGVKVLDMRTNLGLTGGFMAGMKYTFRHNYDYAVQFDADGQHLPEYIPKMVKEAENGTNIVIGSRFVSEKRSFSLRMLGNSIISLAIKLTTGKTVKDPTSGMRLFDRKTINYYVHHSNMTPEPETISFLIKKKFSVKEVQVRMQDRIAGESYFNVSRSIQYMVRVAISIVVLQPFRK